MRGIWMEGFLLGTPKALEIGICFHMGPFWVTQGELSFPTAFEERVKYLLSEFI